VCYHIQKIIGSFGRGTESRNLDWRTEAALESGITARANSEVLVDVVEASGGRGGRAFLGGRVEIRGTPPAPHMGGCDARSRRSRAKHRKRGHCRGSSSAHMRANAVGPGEGDGRRSSYLRRNRKRGRREAVFNEPVSR